MTRESVTHCLDRVDRPGPPRWYGPALGAIWALLLVQVMLPFPANVAVATLSAATAGFLLGRIEGDLGRPWHWNASRHGAPLFVFLLGLLGLGVFAYHVVEIDWLPPALALIAFGASWGFGGRQTTNTSGDSKESDPQ